jgi:aminoglycoside phosphotransferase family enzyme/predicted kinase
MNHSQDKLLRRMLEPDFYDHPVTAVELAETHISTVFLAGEFAYKLKKPVNFGFLDFSTLEKRRACCQEELRLNRRFAPQLYLEVCGVGGPPDRLCLRQEPAVDFLVKMRRFPCRAQLDRVLADGRLTAQQLVAFAQLIADFHQRAASADAAAAFGTVGAVLAPVLENFAQLAPLLPDSATRTLFARLEDWSRQAGEQLRERLQQRQRAGFIRECHGDLHLANMVWWPEQPLLFDCIEFNANLRWIDVINDIAFLIMDLDDRDQAILGWHFLNSYLERTGDYQGLELLAFYKVYRALVRAKVACLRLHQTGLSAAEKAREHRLTHSYLELAGAYIRPSQPQLLIAHGLSGSGKTSCINQLAPVCRAIRIHSDIERKRLAGLTATAGSQSPPGGGLYSGAATARTYQRLLELAEIILKAGNSVMVDATFLQRRQRRQFQQLAARLGFPFWILDFPLAETELRRRIEQRQRQPGQSSEATAEILDLQLSRQEPLTNEEQPFVLSIHPDSPLPELLPRCFQNHCKS